MAIFKPRRLKNFDYKGRYRYFVTICTHMQLQLLIHDDLLNELIKALKESSCAFGFKIWGYCFMPDHLHLLLEGVDHNSDLKKFISAYKQKSGYFFRTAFNNGKASALSDPARKLWQSSYYDHVMRNDEALVDILRYITNNPVRKGIVDNFLDYPYTGSYEIDLRDL